MAHLIRPRSRVRVDGVAKTGQVSPKGTVVHTDHWDDTVDAAANPGPIRVKVKPTWSEWLAFLELEKTTADLRAAQLSGSRDAIRRAVHAHEQAKSAFDSTKFDDKTREVLSDRTNGSTPR